MWENIRAAKCTTGPIGQILLQYEAPRSRVGKNWSGSERSGVGEYLNGAKRSGAVSKYMAASRRVLGAARSAA